MLTFAIEASITDASTAKPAGENGSSATPGDPIKNATLNVSGAILKTDDSGKAVFNLREGAYDVTIKAKGYRTVTDSITIGSSAVTKDIALTPNR